MPVTYANSSTRHWRKTKTQVARCPHALLLPSLEPVKGCPGAGSAPPQVSALPRCVEGNSDCPALNWVATLAFIPSWQPQQDKVRGICREGAGEWAVSRLVSCD